MYLSRTLCCKAPESSKLFSKGVSGLLSVGAESQDKDLIAGVNLSTRG